MLQYHETEKPTESLWGNVDQAEELAPGIWRVGTPSHGGIVLSAERWAAMPKRMQRTPYSDNGQYEEDCDAVLPLLVFRRELELMGEPVGRAADYYQSVPYFRQFDPMPGA